MLQEGDVKTESSGKQGKIKVVALAACNLTVTTRQQEIVRCVTSRKTTTCHFEPETIQSPQVPMCPSSSLVPCRSVLEPDTEPRLHLLSHHSPTAASD